MKDREYHRQYSMDYYYRKKAELIQLLGGRCCKCGSEEALEFDHIDPQTKLFAISSLLSHAWTEVLEEVKKCQLLCKRCHIAKTTDNADNNYNRLRGEDIKSAVLTTEIVIEIKTLRSQGKTLNELMRLFPEVKKPTLNAVISGLTWKHVIVD